LGKKNQQHSQNMLFYLKTKINPKQ
jgi:hypothetical protein